MSYHTNSWCIILTKLSYRRRTTKDDDGFTLVSVFPGIRPWSGVYLCALFSALIVVQADGSSGDSQWYARRLISCDI